jgi:hypothetical protein
VPRSPVLPAASAALALAAACGDQPRPTGPIASGAPRAAALGASCSNTDATQLQQQITALFNASVRTDARTLERALERACPAGGTAATGAMLDYVAKILSWRGAVDAKGQPLITGQNPALWGYLTLLFKYTGYSLPNTEGALGDQGFVGICDDSRTEPKDCLLVSKLKTSGVLIYDGALEKGVLGNRFLVTGAPASCSAIGTRTNLKPYGQCVEVSVDPKPGKLESFEFAPVIGRPAPAVVQTCVAENAPEYLYHDHDAPGGKQGKLGQYSAGATQVFVRPPAPELFAVTPDDALAGKGCTFATTVVQGGPWQDNGIVRLARNALSFFAPREAFAGHGGLGTLPGYASATSRFGPIDPYVFYANFEQDVIGARPDEPLDGSLRGAWQITPPPPGTVSVQRSLGDISDQLAVINQAGGNKADLITLIAKINPSTTPGKPYPFDGTYSVGLDVVVASPRAFISPFVVRSSVGTGTKEIARFELRDGQNSQSGPITFTAGGQTVTAGTWKQNTSQRIEFFVNFEAGEVSLRAGAQPETVKQRFAAADLGQAGWEIGGQDGQIIGVNNLYIAKLAPPQ